MRARTRPRVESAREVRAAVRLSLVLAAVLATEARSQVDAIRRARDAARDATTNVASLGKEPAITTTIDDARDGVAALDGFEPASYSPLADMPRAPGGTYLLVPGTYVLVTQSFCLKPGAYGPPTSAGYLHAAWKGEKASLVSTLIARSVDHPEVPQRQVQLLLWAIVMRADINQLYPETKQAALKLLTSAEYCSTSRVTNWGRSGRGPGPSAPVGAGAGTDRPGNGKRDAAVAGLGRNAVRRRRACRRARGRAVGERGDDEFSGRPLVVSSVRLFHSLRTAHLHVHAGGHLLSGQVRDPSRRLGTDHVGHEGGRARGLGRIAPLATTRRQRSEPDTAARPSVALAQRDGGRAPRTPRARPRRLRRFATPRTGRRSRRLGSSARGSAFGARSIHGDRAAVVDSSRLAARTGAWPMQTRDGYRYWVAPVASGEAAGSPPMPGVGS